MGMTMCPNCGYYFDTSEGGCPNCTDYDDEPMYHIVYDDIAGKALTLTDDEYEEFKLTHPDYT